MKFDLKMNLAFAVAVFAAASATAQQQLAPGVFLLGRFADTNISESSGVILSHRERNAYWTHNDGDDRLFGITRDGRSLGSWSLGGIQTIDFEDMAWSPGRIYIGDIGDNELLRSHIVVYAVPEPGPTFSGSLPTKGQWKLRYPGGERYDAESLLIQGRYGYIITKELVDGHAQVYRFSLRGRGSRGIQELQLQCELDVSGDVGAADITRDGRRLAVVSRERGAYLFELPDGLPSSGRLEPSLFVPYEFDFMEGAAFTRDGLLVTAETGEILLFDNPAFRIRQR